MRLLIILLATVALGGIFPAGFPREFKSASESVAALQTRKPSGTLRANSLCARDEQVIFSCTVKRTAKIVSLCASHDLDKGHGYLQYRFGLPENVELEFPKDRQSTQQQFHYSHYFRYQFDETEIRFNINGYEYSIFDNYDGEEKRAISQQGVSVTALGKPREISFVCSAKPKADYSKLADVLPQNQQ
jgi:hypothetical protein